MMEKRWLVGRPAGGGSRGSGGVHGLLGSMVGRGLEQDELCCVGRVFRELKIDFQPP